MEHFQNEIKRIPDELNVDSSEYKKWREDYLDDCGLYARHIIAEELDMEEYERRN